MMLVLTNPPGTFEDNASGDHQQSDHALVQLTFLRPTSQNSVGERDSDTLNGEVRFAGTNRRESVAGSD